MKLAGDPNNPVRFKDDATADELREEIMSGGFRRLQKAGVIKGWNSEPVGFRRRSIGPQRGVTFIRSVLPTVPISATQRNLFVSNSAG